MDVCLRIDNSGINSSHVMSSVVETSHMSSRLSEAHGESSRDPSATLGMTILHATKHPPSVISTKRSAWRDLSMANIFSNQWEMHTIIRNFSLFYLEVN